MKAWLNKIAKDFPYPCTFDLAGDITPATGSQPLGNFITTKDVFKIMQLSYSTIPLQDLINDGLILGAYFGDNRIAAAKETYIKLTNGDGISEEVDLDQLSDFED